MCRILGPLLELLELLVLLELPRRTDAGRLGLAQEEVSLPFGDRLLKPL
jgi:hypothetical protein